MSKDKICGTVVTEISNWSNIFLEINKFQAQNKTTLVSLNDKVDHLNYYNLNYYIDN